MVRAAELTVIRHTAWPWRREELLFHHTQIQKIDHTIV